MAKLAAWRKARMERNAVSMNGPVAIVLAGAALMWTVGSEAGQSWLNQVLLSLG